MFLKGISASVSELKFSLINGLIQMTEARNFDYFNLFGLIFVYSVVRTFIFLIGTVFKSCIDEHLIRVRWPLLSRFFPDYVYRIN